MDNLNFKDKSINAKKANDTNDNKLESKDIRIYFASNDKKIHYSILCKDTDKLEEIENKLYEKYPQYKNIVNKFLCNGNIIKNNKNLKENNIKDNEIITVYINKTND